MNNLKLNTEDMSKWINKVHLGNSLKVMKELPDNSIDAVITSPPYWNLRDYGNDEQIGNEPHFKDFINNLCNIFDEIKRVLKDTGTCFVNLGDTYGTVSGSMGTGLIEPKYGHNNSRDFKQSDINMHKCLCMIPARFAIEMIDRGWTLRNEIVWEKPNVLPSSASDRFTASFENIYFFVKKNKGYYFEQQLEPYTKSLDRWGGENLEANGNSEWDKQTGQPTYRKRNMRPNPEGRNMRTVWSINTKPSKEKHWASYPQELVERMLKAGCPEGGVVLDPFFGSGTTGVYARKVNRNFIGIEVNPEYIKVAENRLYKEIGMFL